jgi:pimeloyl-ACP methyl ester carboxylesterase
MNRPINVLCILMICAVVTACGARPFVMSPRPEPDVSPWQELTTPGQSGHLYRYLHMNGPSEQSPAFLFLHGGIFDHRMWYYMKSLSKHGALYALEFPDVHAFHNGRIDAMGRIVADFAAVIPEKRIYVVAVSAGAWAAIDYAASCGSSRVDGIVLASTIMYGVTPEEVKTRTRMSRFAVGIAPPTLQRIVDKRARRTKYTAAKGPLQQLDIFHTRPYPYYYQLFHQSLAQGDRPQNTAAIRCPVLVLHGEKDDIMPVETARLAPFMFPNAARVAYREVAGAGHDMVLGEGEQIAGLIASFLFQSEPAP